MRLIHQRLVFYGFETKQQTADKNRCKYKQSSQNRRIPVINIQLEFYGNETANLRARLLFVTKPQNSSLHIINQDYTGLSLQFRIQIDLPSQSCRIPVFKKQLGFYSFVATQSIMGLYNLKSSRLSWMNLAVLNRPQPQKIM